MIRFAIWFILIREPTSSSDRPLWRTEMDQAVQIIGLTIMCLGMAGFAVGVIGIIRSFAKHQERSGKRVVHQDEPVG